MADATPSAGATVPPGSAPAKPASSARAAYASQRASAKVLLQLFQQSSSKPRVGEAVAVGVLPQAQAELQEMLSNEEAPVPRLKRFLASAKALKVSADGKLVTPPTLVTLWEPKRIRAAAGGATGDIGEVSFAAGSFNVAGLSDAGALGLMHPDAFFSLVTVLETVQSELEEICASLSQSAPDASLASPPTPGSALGSNPTPASGAQPPAGAGLGASDPPPPSGTGGSDPLQLFAAPAVAAMAREFAAAVPPAEASGLPLSFPSLPAQGGGGGGGGASAAAAAGFGPRLGAIAAQGAGALLPSTLPRLAACLPQAMRKPERELTVGTDGTLRQKSDSSSFALGCHQFVLAARAREQLLPVELRAGHAAHVEQLLAMWQKYPSSALLRFHEALVDRVVQGVSESLDLTANMDLFLTHVLPAACAAATNGSGASGSAASSNPSTQVCNKFFYQGFCPPAVDGAENCQYVHRCSACQGLFPNFSKCQDENCPGRRPTDKSSGKGRGGGNTGRGGGGKGKGRKEQYAGRDGKGARGGNKGSSD